MIMTTRIAVAGSFDRTKCDGSFRGSQCQGQYASGLPECRRHCSLRSSGSGNFSAFHSVSGRKAAALLANYSMHYFGSPFVSSDYYGLFAANIARRIGADSGNGPFVAMMSQGTSGDQMWMDYGKPKTDVTLEAYAEAVTDVVYRAYQKIQYRTPITLAIAEAELTLKRRVPDTKRLAWARELLAQMPGAKPRNQSDVYAREQESSCTKIPCAS